eukprot:11684516-Alexandrium_andersonii.AAC.1
MRLPHIRQQLNAPNRLAAPKHIARGKVAGFCSRWTTAQADLVGSSEAVIGESARKAVASTTDASFSAADQRQLPTCTTFERNLT